MVARPRTQHRRCSPARAPQAPTAGTGRAGAASCAVVDGDTVDVDLGGRTERVRLLGIDTPETVDPDRPVECFGPEASARTAELLPDRHRGASSSATSRPATATAACWPTSAEPTTTPFVNEVLVAEGYAEVLVIEPNGAYADRLPRRPSRPRGPAGAGLWGSRARTAGR